MPYPGDLRIIRKKSLNSTNSFLKDRIKSYSDITPVMITSEKQTGGRGRGENAWFSPEGSGLFSSFLFKFQTETKIELLPMTAGVSVAEAIKRISGIQCSLKWPNDIEFKGKKIGGILTENSFFEDSVLSIIGIGINVNVNPEEFPSALFGQATSISIIRKEPLDMETLNMALASDLIRRTDELRSGISEGILKKYRELIRHEYGEKILFRSSGKILQGEFRGVDDSGGIIFFTKKDGEKTFYSGEISGLSTERS